MRDQSKSLRLEDISVLNVNFISKESQDDLRTNRSEIVVQFLSY
jgi:hypothetical protein